MSEESNVQDRIEAYHFGEMSLVERAAFEADLARDADLASALAAFEALQADLSLVEEADFLEEVRGWGAELAGEAHPYPEARKFRRRWPIGIAAAILLLLLPAYLLLRPVSDARLFDRYFEPYPDVVTARGADAPAFQSGMAAYNAGDYAGALPLFEAYLDSLPGDADGLFYGGIAELEAGDPLAAAEMFADLEAEGSIYGTTARWYHALALLRAGQRAAAVPLLQSVADGEGVLAEEAAALLGDLGEGD